MARRYHQSKKDRMHEKEGMEKRMDERHEDHPSKHMGHGHFANMPPEEIFQPYPREKYNYGAYDDTIYGIDETDTESADKVEHHPSHQK